MSRDQTPAWTAWSALDERTRDEVSRLARAGVRHPNDAVAAAARGWADVLLGSAENDHAERWWRRGFVVVAVLLTAWWAPMVFPDGDSVRAEKAWALRVIAADEGTSPPGTKKLEPRWTAEQRRRQQAVLLPVMLVLVAVLVFLAVVATRP